MTTKKTIAVVGATGKQGGGLVRAILNDPKGGFAVRALTRDVDSDKAKRLEQLGAEVVAANVDGPESLERAFHGAYGVFCVTFFLEHSSPEKELAEAANMAHATKRAAIQHVIWSTLEDTRKWVPLIDRRMPTLKGKYKVPHFDAKGEADKVFTGLGLPVTFLLTSFFWDNFIYRGMAPKKGPDGKLAVTLPMDDKKLPGIAVEDIGRCAYGIFKHGHELAGEIGTALASLFARKYIQVAIANSRGPATLASLKQELGPNVVPQSIQDACEAEIIFLAMPFPAHKDVAKQFKQWNGKIVVDVTNAFHVAPEELGGLLSSEVVSQAFVGARLVKAFNHLPAKELGTNPPLPGRRQVVFVSSTDADASASVAAVATQLGFAPVELGRLDQGGAPLHVLGGQPGGLLFQNLVKLD